MGYPLLDDVPHTTLTSTVRLGGHPPTIVLYMRVAAVQDLPLYCTSAILVLEGFKEFVVVPDEVVPSLRINITSGLWEHPIKHDGHVYQNLQVGV